MFNHRLSAIAGAAVLTVSLSAHATDGTINFDGQIQSSTCHITVGTETQTVKLETISKVNLDVAGKTGGNREFSIFVSGCDGTNSTAAAYFENNPAVTSPNGNLKNTATVTPAANVELQLTNQSDGSVIDLTKGTASDQKSHPGNIDVSGNATLRYGVAYYATGAVTQGKVTSQVTYSMTYN